jgi:hypothetical protein
MFRITAVFILPVLIFFLVVADASSQPSGIDAVSLTELIAVLENDKASGHDTQAALTALASMKAQAVPAILSMMRLLHQGNRVDCYSFECMGMDATGSVLKVLQEMGPAASPAVPELINLLNLSTGSVSRPPRPDPLTPFYSCYQNTYCAEQIYETLKSIGPGAAGAVPSLISLAQEQASHPGRNDYREQLLSVLGAIGPNAAPAIPMMFSQANAPEQQGRIVSAAITALVQIAPNDPSVFPLFAKALIRPRALNLYNAGEPKGIEEVFVKKTNYEASDFKVLNLEIMTALADSNAGYQLLSEYRMRPICDIFARYPEYSSLSIPVLTRILEVYPANGAVNGSDIVMKTLGAFGLKASQAVPALTKKALDGMGSVYRKEAVAALEAIGTPEAQAAIADHNAGKWRNY